jgi:hypothetical protein
MFGNNLLADIFGESGEKLGINRVRGVAVGFGVPLILGFAIVAAFAG